MCLTVITAPLGPAHAALDMGRLLLIFAPGLNGEQRDRLARDLLAGAGQEQDDVARPVCLCGFELDTAPAEPAHRRWAVPSLRRLKTSGQRRATAVLACLLFQPLFNVAGPVPQRPANAMPSRARAAVVQPVQRPHRYTQPLG